MMTPKIATVQTSSAGDWQRRLDKADELCRAAVADGAQLLVLPENFAYYAQKNLNEMADIESAYDGPVTSRLSLLAKELGVWIVGGTIPMWDEQQTDRPFAAVPVFNNEGNICCRYNKMHLFDVDIPDQNKRYRESDFYFPGDGSTVVFDSPVGRIGVIVCYDLRFPYLAQSLADQGAEIIVAPSAFTRETGKVHWQLLLQARALDTLCYVAGANLAGRDHPKVPTWGGSTIVNPWGKVVADMEDQEGFICAEIDLEKQQKIRQSLPLSQHRRSVKSGETRL